MSNEPSPEPTTLPDPKSVLPRDRQLEILALRRRLLSGEILPEADIQRGLRLIRADRSERTGRRPAAGGRAKKPAVEAFDLSDF